MRIPAAIAISLCMLSSVAQGQTSEDRGAIKIMQSGSQLSRQGPAENFTGSVRVDPLFQPNGPARASGALVTFEPGARTAWHTHPYGQTIYVTEGLGRCQRRDGPIEVISPGDRVYFEPGEDHWHGAAPNRFMTHLAMQEVDEQGSPVTWGEHVTDEEYDPAPAS